MRQLLLAVPFILLTACDSDSPRVAPNLAEARAAIEENFDQWKYFQLDNYAYSINYKYNAGCGRTGDVVSGELPTVRVIVEDGEVKEAFLSLDPGEPVTEDWMRPLGTLDDLFQWALDELDDRPQVVTSWLGNGDELELPNFDADFNFIRNIYIRNETDGECRAVGIDLHDFN